MRQSNQSNSSDERSKRASQIFETAFKWKTEYNTFIVYNKHINPKFFVRHKGSRRIVSNAYAAGHAFLQ